MGANRAGTILPDALLVQWHGQLVAELLRQETEQAAPEVPGFSEISIKPSPRTVALAEAQGLIRCKHSEKIRVISFSQKRWDIALFRWRDVACHFFGSLLTERNHQG